MNFSQKKKRKKKMFRKMFFLFEQSNPDEFALICSV